MEVDPDREYCGKCNIILHLEIKEYLFQYLKKFMHIYVNYCMTINLEKTGFFSPLGKFVGFDIQTNSSSNRSAKSKINPFQNLINTFPEILCNTRSFVVILDFYFKHMLNFKLLI